MQIIIDIPEEKYQGIINMAEEILDASKFCSPRYLYKAVLDGTTLPKGHGRLMILSEDKIEEHQINLNFSSQKWISEVGLSNATVAIIEADTEREEQT